VKRKIFSILFALVLAVSLMLVPAASVGASPGPGIVGLWHLDGNANDSSGNNLNGTVSPSGASFVSGKFGQALSVDGTGYVQVPDSTLLEPSEITVEAWVKRLGSPGSTRYIVSKYLPNKHGAYSSYGLYTGSGGLRFYIGYSGSWIGSPQASASAVWDGDWHHVAGTFDGSQIKLYLDGVQVDGATSTLQDIYYSGTGDLFIGSYYNGSWLAFSGEIDEVRIWDTATRSFVLDAEPEEDVNPQDTQHTITATVEISKVGGGTTPAPGETVNFDVTGANPQSGSDDTDSSGVATFTYTGSMMGTDTINAWVDQDWSGDFNSANDAWDEVTKYWLEHFVTGGGIIREGKGKNAYSITFGGNVGYDLVGNEVGQWNINFHNVNDSAIDKGHFHSTEITDIGFFDITVCPEPDPPDADYNYAHFVATGRFNGEDGWEVRFNMTDYGEGNKTEPDGIRVRLWNASHILVYDSSETGESYTGVFTNEGRCALARRTRLDGGNIQIHPPEMPTP